MSTWLTGTTHLGLSCESIKPRIHFFKKENPFYFSLFIIYNAFILCIMFFLLIKIIIKIGGDL